MNTRRRNPEQQHVQAFSYFRYPNNGFNATSFWLHEVWNLPEQSGVYK
jgi:hypothetical protein